MAEKGKIKGDPEKKTFHKLLYGPSDTITKKQHKKEKAALDYLDDHTEFVIELDRIQKEQEDKKRTREAAKGGYIKKYARGGGVRKTHSF